ncbi:transcription factor, partial [Ascosphaera atra]
MAPPKRRGTRRAELTEHSDPLDSSPSQRSGNKRRKVERISSQHDNDVEQASVRAPSTALGSAYADRDRDQDVEGNLPSSRTSPAPSSDDDDSMQVNQELVESVIATLGVATVDNEPVTIGAMNKYGNYKTQQEQTESVKAYAKIAGREWTYFMKKLSITIGRNGSSGGSP